MDKFVLLMWGLAGLSLLVGLIGPRRFYWLFAAWAYKDPEANEPSDAMYAVQRFAAFAAAAVLVIMSLQYGDGRVRGSGEATPTPSDTDISGYVEPVPTED